MNSKVVDSYILCNQGEKQIVRKYELEDVKKTAKDLNGKCLSKEYKNTKIKLKFICKENHIFEKNYEALLKGSWCPECTKQTLSKRFRKYNIKDMEELAKRNGGECLSLEYINRNLPLKWKCANGHIWKSAASNIIVGHWCPSCGRKKANENRKRYGLEDIQTISRAKKGVCISKDYSTTRSTLTFKCEKGHIWSTEANQILKGSWCPDCAGIKKKNIEEIREVALKRKGKLLSTEYHNAHRKLKWECSNGHTFEANYNNVRAGKWCPKCRTNYNEDKCRFILEKLTGYPFPKTRNILPNSIELDGYCDKLNIAFEYQGKQHYEFVKFFHRNEQALDSQIQRDKAKKDACKKAGIKLIDIPYTLNTDEVKVKFLVNSLESFGIMTVCDNVDVSILLKDFYTVNTKLIELKNLAEKRKGKLLSQEYNGSHQNLTFKCENGHIWNASPANILAGKWCRKCAYKSTGLKLRSSIEHMKSLAEEKGGKCLSSVYINAKTKLTWMCGKEHVWEMSGDNVKQGKWCPRCSRENRKLTIEEMKKLARKKKGQCLSEVYVDNNTKMQWQCEKGHVWNARAREIKRGIWCPDCGTNKLTLKDMQVLASARNGTCLSNNYINANTSLTWKCSSGHIWNAKPSNIKNGTWCPDCAGNTKKTIEDMQRFAHSKNGKCLSKIYINIDTKLLWQCEYQHTWEATPYMVTKKGKWCPSCK